MIVAPYQGEFQSSSFPCFVSLFFEMFWTCECEFLFGIANRLNHRLVLTCLLGDSRSIFFVYIYSYKLQEYAISILYI